MFKASFTVGKRVGEEVGLAEVGAVVGAPVGATVTGDAVGGVGAGLGECVSPGCVGAPVVGVAVGERVAMLSAARTSYESIRKERETAAALNLPKARHIPARELEKSW